MHEQSYNTQTAYKLQNITYFDLAGHTNCCNRIQLKRTMTFVERPQRATPSKNYKLTVCSRGGVTVLLSVLAVLRPVLPVVTAVIVTGHAVSWITVAVIVVRAVIVA